MKIRKKPFYKRKLPHWQPPGATFFITWRLFGSLPQAALDKIENTRRQYQREPDRAAETEEQRRVRHFKQLFAVYDSLLDELQDGPDWLKDEALATLVEKTLLERYATLYQLWAYVVMPNHVHVFLRPKLVGQTSVCPEPATPQPAERPADEPQFVPLRQITQSLKGYSALEANKLLQRTGQAFWQDESYDHWARDDEEFFRIIAYIERNPVKAGLAAKPEDWRWSSAAERKRRGVTEIIALT